MFHNSQLRDSVAIASESVCQGIFDNGGEFVFSYVETNGVFWEYNTTQRVVTNQKLLQQKGFH